MLLVLCLSLMSVLATSAAVPGCTSDSDCLHRPDGLWRCLPSRDPAAAACTLGYKYNETGTLTPPEFSFNGGVCSGYAALAVADEYMDGNSTMQDAFLSDDICPNGGSTANILFGNAGRQLTANCNGTNAELLQVLMFEPLPKLPPDIHRMVHDMGAAT